MSVLSDTRSRFGQRSMFVRILLMASIPLVLVAIAGLSLPHRRPLGLDRRCLCPGRQDRRQLRCQRPRRRGRGQGQPAGQSRPGAVPARRQQLQDRARQGASQSCRDQAADRRAARDLQAAPGRCEGGAGHARLYAARSRPPGAAPRDAYHLAAEIRRGAAQSRRSAATAFLGTAAARQCAGEPRRQSRHPDGSASAGACRPRRRSIRRRSISPTR